MKSFFSVQLGIVERSDMELRRRNRIRQDGFLQDNAASLNRPGRGNREARLDIVDYTQLVKLLPSS